MRANRNRQPELYGVAPIGVSRYFALYLTQAGWLLLGAYLLGHAYWPSTCRPHDVLEIYGCSARLPESRGWIEASQRYKPGNQMPDFPQLRGARLDALVAYLEGLK